jgi:pyruvate kinase
MVRRTKIIATIGPASDSEASIKGLIDAGMDVARLGLAHGTIDSQLERYHRIRQVAQESEHPVGIMVDLPGPKVRAGTMPDAGLDLEPGQEIRLAPGTDKTTDETIYVDYESLLSDVHQGDKVSFGDGAVSAEAVDRSKDAIIIRVTHGGLLQGRPGVHIPSERLRLTTPTRKDLEALDAFVAAGVDMVALSFVRSAHDIRRVGTEPHPRGPLIIAKIETRAAVENLEGIILAAGAIMVARGDLGAEMPIEELPHLQKRILRRCIALGRPAITATQMLESMIHAPSPTRAEASDIANAVFDGSSALMLSAESAIGDDPVNAVATMARIAARADHEFDYEGWPAHLAKLYTKQELEVDDVVTNGMTNAAWRAATETGAAAIVCVTLTGFTVRSIARFRPQAKIYALSTDQRTVDQLTLSWGATPMLLEPGLTQEQAISHSVDVARQQGDLHNGDLVIVLSGSPGYPGQATDSLKIVRI